MKFLLRSAQIIKLLINLLSLFQNHTLNSFLAIDEVLHNLWDNTFLQLVEFSVIYDMLPCQWRNFLSFMRQCFPASNSIFLLFMRQHFPAIGVIFGHLWDNAFPTLMKFSIIYETLPRHWRNYPSFMRQLFPPLTNSSVIYETTLPAIDKFFCHLWDNASLPLTTFSIIYRTTLPAIDTFSVIYETTLLHHWLNFPSFMRQCFPTIDEIFHDLWDNSFQAIDEIFCHLWDNASQPLTEFFCYLWDNTSPPLTGYSVSYEKTLPCHWQNFLSFMRCFPTNDGVFHHLWDNSSPPLMNFFVIYETMLLRYDRIFSHLWDNASLSWKEFYGIRFVYSRY